MLAGLFEARLLAAAHGRYSLAAITRVRILVTQRKIRNEECSHTYSHKIRKTKSVHTQIRNEISFTHGLMGRHPPKALTTPVLLEATALATDRSLDPHLTDRSLE